MNWHNQEARMTPLKPSLPCPVYALPVCSVRLQGFIGSVAFLSSFILTEKMGPLRNEQGVRSSLQKLDVEMYESSFNLISGSSSAVQGYARESCSAEPTLRLLKQATMEPHLACPSPHPECYWLLIRSMLEDLPRQSIKCQNETAQKMRTRGSSRT